MDLRSVIETHRRFKNEKKKKFKCGNFCICFYKTQDFKSSIHAGIQGENY